MKDMQKEFEELMAGFCEDGEDQPDDLGQYCIGFIWDFRKEIRAALELAKMNELFGNSEQLGWQPIETLPDGVSVDVWVCSKNNPRYGRRAVDICMIDGKYFGADFPQETLGEYAAYWRHMPAAPPAQGEEDDAS